MSLATRRRAATRTVLLDRSLEALPLFRLSDSADDGAVSVTTDEGGRWRVLAPPGDRLPGTFDQDVYVELMRRFQDAGAPAHGTITFTLHAFLRSMGRRVDGRTYDQLRGALTRLERTILESQGAYFSATANAMVEARFPVLSAVVIERRRVVDHDQFQLFSAVQSAEPGEARVVIAPQLRDNLSAGHTSALVASRYLSLPSPVARRLYRLIEVARADDMVTWRIALDRLREQLPLSQRYPSHLQRVLQPAHEMLVDSEIVRDAAFRQQGREWYVDYILAPRSP